MNRYLHKTIYNINIQEAAALVPTLQPFWKTLYLQLIKKHLVPAWGSRKRSEIQRRFHGDKVT